MSVRVSVPPTRWARWCENFERGHGPTTYRVEEGALRGGAEDGSTFVARLPFDVAFDGEPHPDRFSAALVVPEEWGLLLVRKGGFAMARLTGEQVVDSKVGRRHVQGRTKAGGQSQQRFARRRDNQARQAYEAAAGHAVRVLGARPLRTLPLVVGGDRAAVTEVLTDSDLRPVSVVGAWLTVPDPRRAVLEQGVRDALAIGVDVTNAGTGV